MIVLSYTIITVSLLNYFLLLYTIFLYTFQKPKNIFQFKIIYFKLTIISVIIYILSFFIILYLWRLSSIQKLINLKEILDNLFRLHLIYCYHLPFTNQLYIFCIIILIFGFSFLSIIKLHNICQFHIYKLYFYIMGYYYIHKHIVQKIHDILGNLGSQDLITYTIKKFLAKVVNFTHNYNVDWEKLPKYHYYNIMFLLLCKQFKLVQFLITISPIFIIIYDCIFHSYYLIHLYPYLLIYTPVIILRKITKRVVANPINLMKTIHEILYNDQDKNVLYAVSPKIKPILDDYITNGFQTDLEIRSFDPTGIQFYLSIILRFDLNYPERNAYLNSEGICLHLTPENKVFEEIEEVERLFDLNTEEGRKAFFESKEENNLKYHYKNGEEWILLCKK